MRIGIDGRNLVTPWSGISRYVVSASRALASRGHAITLYLPGAPHSTTPALDFADVNLASANSLAERQIWSLTALPRRVHHDVPDLFWGPAHRLPPLGMANIPKALTIHDLVWVKAPETMRTRTLTSERTFMSSALRRADLVMAVSNATRRDIVSRWPQFDGKTMTIHCGCELPSERPNWRRDNVSDPSDRYFLFVGTLEPRKNLARLLEAWSRLTEDQRRGHTLLIVGAKGWGISDLKQMIDGFGIGESVCLAGFLDEDALNEIYRRASGLLMPSLYEGFGLPVIEAQARGLPVVVSDEASLPEVAGEDAILVDPRDVESIRTGLAKIAGLDPSDPVRRRRAIENASRFTWQIMAERTEQAFENLLASRGSC